MQIRKFTSRHFGIRNVMYIVFHDDEKYHASSNSQAQKTQNILIKYCLDF